MGEAVSSWVFLDQWNGIFRDWMSFLLSQPSVSKHGRIHKALNPMSSLASLLPNS